MGEVRINTLNRDFPSDPPTIRGLTDGILLVDYSVDDLNQVMVALSSHRGHVRLVLDLEVMQLRLERLLDDAILQSFDFDVWW